MKRVLALFVFLTSVAFSWTAYAQSRELKPIRLMYQTTAFGAPIFVALAKGWYEEALNKVGYTLKTSSALFGPPIVEAMAAGQVDIGELGVAPFVVAVSRGLPLKAVITTNIGGESIMVGKDSRINSIKDLKGKKIAIPAKGNMQDFIIRRALLADGLNPNSDVSWVELSAPDMSTSLVRNQIDAAVLWEPWTARLVLQGQRVLASGQAVWPDHDNQLIAVTGAAIRDDEPAVRAVVEQTRRGLEYILANPEDSISLTAKFLGIERAVIAESWKLMIRRPSGEPNAKSLEEFADALLEWGYSKHKISAGNMIDDRFLKD
jgi:sulfonate transport system substrate-binding protein